MNVGGRPVGLGHPPLVIAEMSGNHNRSRDRALAIVEAAAKAGAHGLKLQTYTADTMTLDLDEGDFRVEEPGSPWRGRALYDLYQEAATPWEWHRPIVDRARGLGMVPFSTPFDASAVAFLETLAVPLYKIASFEIVDLPLLRAVGATGKPVLLSTGMATLAEIEEAVTTLRAAGSGPLVLLRCTSSYPAPPEQANLRSLVHLRETFACEVGLSDHTMGIGVALAAVALGATVIEKHFTLSRADGGVDASFSLEPQELAALVEESERAWRSLGQVSYGPTRAEQGSLVFRRSLYVVADLRAGDRLDATNLRAIRPGAGLSPRYYEQLLGCRVNRNVRRGTPMSWDLVLERGR